MQAYMCPSCGSQRFTRWKCTPFFRCDDCQSRLVIVDIAAGELPDEHRTPAQLFEQLMDAEWKRRQAECVCDKEVSL
jgi:hypothetical protein